MHRGGVMIAGWFQGRQLYFNDTVSSRCVSLAPHNPMRRRSRRVRVRPAERSLEGFLHAYSEVRSAMNTNSRPGRSGASRISFTTKPASWSESSISALLRKRSVESEVRMAPSASKMNVIRERDDRQTHIRKVHPRLAAADPWNLKAPMRVLVVPLFPSLPRWVTNLEHQ
jgi:hypothetical protein